MELKQRSSLSFIMGVSVFSILTTGNRVVGVKDIDVLPNGLYIVKISRFSLRKVFFLSLILVHLQKPIGPILGSLSCEWGHLIEGFQLKCLWRQVRFD